MPANESIYGLVDTQAPAKLSSLLDPMNSRVRKAKQMALDEEMQGFEDKRALRDLLKTANTRDPEQLAQMAYDKGLPGAAQDFLRQSQAIKEASLREQKNKIDMANSQLAYQKHAQELASSKAGFVFANPTDENMAQLLMSQGVPQDQITGALSQLPKDVVGRQRFMVNAFSDWKTRSEQVNPKAKEIPFEYEQLPDGSVRMKPGVLEAKRQLAEAGRSNTINYSAPQPVFNPATGQVELVQFGNQGQQKQTGLMPPPKESGALSATEDERKAAGWLNQARNAYNNMAEAAKNNPSSIAPSLLEAAIPSEGVKNYFRDPQRQRFMQAASSFSEAALRAATGAGVNKEEAMQKVRELTPVYGDSKEVQKQKLDSLKVYLDSLEARAGRAKGNVTVSPPSTDVFVNDAARRINDARKAASQSGPSVSNW